MSSKIALNLKAKIDVNLRLFSHGEVLDPPLSVVEHQPVVVPLLPRGNIEQQLQVLLTGMLIVAAIYVLNVTSGRMSSCLTV